jgi:hypothetical protein
MCVVGEGAAALVEYTDTATTMGLVEPGSPMVAEAKVLLTTARTTKLELVAMMHLRDNDGKTEVLRDKLRAEVREFRKTTGSDEKEHVHPALLQVLTKALLMKH